MGKHKGQKKPSPHFARGSCRFGAQCWFVHSLPAGDEQPDPHASASASAGEPSKIDKIVSQVTSGFHQGVADLVSEVTSETKRLEQELRDSERARSELQRELRESERARAELQRELDEASQRASKQVASIEAENEKLRRRLQDALARPSGASSSQLAYHAGFCGAEWCFESGPDEWTSLPADRSAELLRCYQDLTKGGQAAFRMRSGTEEYAFDLRAMSQTNTKTGKVRAIRCQLHVPSNWTRCTCLANIYQASVSESFEVSGFQDAAFNGTYVESSFDKIHGRSVWWHVLGTVVMYACSKNKDLLLLRCCPEYSNSRNSMTKGASFCSAACTSAAGPRQATKGWKEKFKGGWTKSAQVQMVPGLSSTSPLMEIAVEFWEKPVLEEFAKLLRGSVVHQTQHHGASCCTSFKDSVEVVRVLRIENWHLWTKYKSHLEQVRRDLSKLGVVLEPVEPALPPALSNLPLQCETLDAKAGEYTLFHGTDYKTAVQIALEGFDFRLSNPGFYGQGTYFASQACKSHQYAKKGDGLHTVIFSRVVVGDIAYAAEVDKELKRPPPRAGSSRCCDSVVAKPGPMPGHHAGEQTHQEFVIFDKFQAYPEFIVQYTCGA